MKLTIIGTGYVGLVTGSGFANLGNSVICLDIDKEKIERLSRGEPTIYEPGLAEIVKRNLEAGRLEFSTDTRKAVQEAEAIFICVGTPCNERCEADLTAVDQAASDIGRFMNGYRVVATKSTVPVGTADRVRRIIGENQSTPMEFDVVSNPEFLREGAAVKDFENPDRIIVGTDSEKAREVMITLYNAIARTTRPIVFTDIASAEITKYAGNAMLATRISFMNQLAYLCEKTGADIKAVARGIGLDTRIGPRFLQAGVGYGGSCFPKDVKALIATLREKGCDADLFEAVDRINERQKTLAVDKLASAVNLEGAKIALWGLSFKPKTDDIREAPGLSIIRELNKRGAVVQAYDPVAVDASRALMPDITYFDNPYEAVKDCDALVLVTEWDEFRNSDLLAVKALLRGRVIVDGRNIYDPEAVRSVGLTYIGFGR